MNLRQCLTNHAKETMAVFLASYETDQNCTDRYEMEYAFEKWTEEFLNSNAVWYTENNLTQEEEDLNEANIWYQEEYQAEPTQSFTELIRRFKVAECDWEFNGEDLRLEFSSQWEDKYGELD